MKFVITGATGRTSRFCIDRLLDRGVAASDLILVSRSPERAELAPYAARGAELRYCDFTDMSSVVPALRGGERMYLMPMNHPPGMVDEAAVKTAVVREAKAAGVRYCIYQSFVAAASEAPEDDDYATECALRASGMGWAIMRTGVFSESLGRECKRYLREGRIPCDLPDAPRAYVTRDDIAAAGAELLLRSELAGRIYNVVGATMTMRELAALLTDISGRQIEIVPSDKPWYSGNLAAPESDLPALLGRNPITVENQFRADAQELLTGKPVGAEVKFGFQWQARGMETRPDDLGLIMNRLYDAARDGDTVAVTKFRAALADNAARTDLWRRTHPEWFQWEK
jgi:NAD(P)H dehydrogenase (quinone)